MSLNTQLTDLLKISKPIMLAGMSVAAGPKLAAAVSDAGGIGVLGGLGFSPKMLRNIIKELKEFLVNKNAPFGIDLLLPQVGGNARKTNSDYTGGNLPELIDIIIDEKATLFVSAVGLPPKWAIDKLHAAGIIVGNIIGAPKHAVKAAELGVDLIIAQGGEAGGHSGFISTTVLIPEVADVLKGKISAFTGQPICLVAAGGIYDSRGLASSLALGASGVWVGTRFVCAEEAGATPRHQKGIIAAGDNATVQTLIYTGRPMRVLKNPYINGWQARQDDITELCDKGIVPFRDEQEKEKAAGKEMTFEDMMEKMPLLSGQCGSAIKDVLPASVIMDEMVTGATEILNRTSAMVAKL